ncbi:MAG: PqqD family protein [Muribaculaceae bacterium]|nr:PqqD family protein [Muribaculaceae bacterium]
MKIKKGFTLRKVMTQNVILAEGTNADSFGKILTLNDSAAMLWNALIGKDFEAADAARLLTTTYNIPPQQAQEDARYIINLMTEKGLLDQ